MQNTVSCQNTPMTPVPCQCFERGTYIHVNQPENTEPRTRLAVRVDTYDSKIVAYLDTGGWDNAEEVTGLAVPKDSVITIQANLYK